MTATKLNFPIEQGADFKQTFVVPVGPGYPASIANAIAALQVRSFAGDTVAVATLTTENGGLAINAATRTITATLNAATTAFIPPGLYVYDLKLLDTSDKTYCLFQGTVAVSGQVTIIALIIVSNGTILLENGGAIQQENGDKIEVETPAASQSVGMENGGAVQQKNGNNIVTEG